MLLPQSLATPYGPKIEDEDDDEYEVDLLSLQK
jgi:hypothetical protein